MAEAGLDFIAAGLSTRERRAELGRRVPTFDGLSMDEARAVAFSVNFGELAAPPMLEALRPIAADWRPDVILHDAAELAGPLSPPRPGSRRSATGSARWCAPSALGRAAERVAPLWEAAGLAPDPDAGSYRGLYVDIYPPSLGSTSTDDIPRRQLRRPAEGPRAAGSLVYVTFGTIFNEVDDGFRAAVLGAAAAAEEVLVTVGPEGDPAAVGAVPDNVRVERYVPQAEVLPGSAAVVTHGGSGTVLAALAHGVPLLCLPRGADQFSNARNVAQVGAGAVLLGADTTQEAVRAGLTEILGSPAIATAAGALADEIARDARRHRGGRRHRGVRRRPLSTPGWVVPRSCGRTHPSSKAGGSH